MWHDPLFEKVAKIVDPEDKLSGGEIIKLVEEKFTSTNSAMDAIALCKIASDYYERDLPFSDIKWLKLLDKMAGVA